MFRVRGVYGLCALALAAAWALPVQAGHRTVDLSNLKKDVDLPPGGYGDAHDMKVMVQEVFNPGMSDKRGCRLQISFMNQSKVKLNLRMLITTYDSLQQPADTNLVPSGDLEPGQSVMRLFSCKPAETVEAARDNEYAWPNTCDVNGVEQAPCPVAIHFSATLGIIDPK